MTEPAPATREIRAHHDENTLVVYQAYSPQIADAAVAAGTYASPFERERMTWIKPSFLWMMYRCSWATKPGQERVLAITITRAGLDWALANACLSEYEPALYGSHEAWEERKRTSPVRVQWDPERSLALDRLEHRAIQIGLGGEAVVRYVDEWICAIADVTPLAREIGALVGSDRLDDARALLPVERRLVLPADAAAGVGAT